MAWRYLFARKSHSAVGVIAIVSVCGVALATMAIVCVLSVFNGFRGLVDERESRLIPDLLVTARRSVIENADSLAAVIAACPGVEIASPVIDDDALANHDMGQVPVRLLGVNPRDYAQITGIGNMAFDSEVGEYNVDDESHIADTDEVAASGEFNEDALLSAGVLDDGVEASASDPQAVLSIGAAMQLGLRQDAQGEWVSDVVHLFMPRRTATALSTLNPAASFMMENVVVEAVVQTDRSGFDTNTVIVDIDLARRLLEYDNQATSIYVKVTDTLPASARSLGEKLGTDYIVSDRMQQQTLYLRMISIEKWITFLLLSFILLIASFNVISTISMLIVDKRRDLLTLNRIGASRAMIGEIFCWESAYVCIGGMVCGMLLGVAICLLQQYFGFITITGDESRLIVKAYPVQVRVADILIVLVPGILIALITAVISSRFARRQSRALE